MSSENFSYAISQRNSPWKPWLMANRFVDVVDRKTGVKAQVPLPLSESTLQRTIEIPYSPQSNPNSNVLVVGSSNFTDVYIQNFDSILVDFYIVLTLAETGGANSVTPVSAPLIIDNMQLMANNSGTEFQRLYGQPMWSDFGCFTTEDVQMLAPKINMGTNFQPNTTISASGTYTMMYIPVGNCFAYMKPFLGRINNYLTIRIWWNGNSVYAGTGTLALTNVQLFGVFLDIPNEEKDGLRRFYDDNILDYPVFTTIPAPLPQIFTASANVDVILGSFQGEMSYIQVFFMSSTTGAGQQTITYPGDTCTFSFLDTNKNSIISPVPLRADILRYIKTARKFAGNFYANVGAIPIMFDPAVSYAILYGVQSGYFEGTTKEHLNFTLPAAWVTGTYTMGLYLRTRQHVHINPGGKITVELP